MPELETLTRRRGAFKSKITATIKHLNEANEKVGTVDSSSKSALLIEMDIRVIKLTEAFEQFEIIQNEIEIKTDNYEEQLEERNTIEDSYYRQIALMKQFVRENTPEAVDDSRAGSSPGSNQGSNAVSAIKLPQINLPNFAGSYENWLEFRDMFQSLIHDNEQIGEIQKFHYLRAALQHSAAQIIHSIEFSASNYRIAWDLLNERYNNKALLVNTHVKALFNIASLTKESSTELRSFIDQISKNLRSLEILKQPTNQWDTLINYLISTKLDKVTLREWEERKSDNLPTLDELRKFLKQKADMLETLEMNKSITTKPSVKIQQHSKTFSTWSKNNECYLCKESHRLYNCERFLKLAVDQRIVQVKKLNLCFKCLNKGHGVNDCRSGSCRKCARAHNTLLHLDRKPEEVGAEDKREARSGAYTSNVLMANSSQALLSTALVQIIDANGYPWSCRALLDCGAQSNFMTMNFFNKLKIPKAKVHMSVMGINQVTTTINFKCEVSLQAMHNEFETTTSCLLMETLSDNIPHQTITDTSYSMPNYIRLADPGYNKPAPIDMIIGAGLFWSLLCVGQHNLGSGALSLQKTRLGWIVTSSAEVKQIALHVNCGFGKTKELQSQLEKFWLLEELPADKMRSSEEKRCDEIFYKTTRRNDDGRFVVTIPLKEAADSLGTSKMMALTRFEALERRFAKNEIFKERYTGFMQEYLQLGHMSKIEESQDNKIVNYLPHHGVLKEDSVTTKLRVVFDGSAITSSGYSFNNIQLIGKSLQDELLTIIMRFRQHNFVVCADVEKMYRQIWVEPSQRSLQCILWRNTPNDEIGTYTLNTVTYGTASAPYLAVKCLRQLGIDCQTENPKVAQTILTDFYMDDLLTGGITEEETLQLAKEVADTLKTGCFTLRKWISNSSEILKGLESCSNEEIINLGEKENTRTLGLYWSPKDDTLLFNISLKGSDTNITKRNILSQIAQIFDPLGLLSPVIITAKIIMQELWSCKIGWDEGVPQWLHTKWKHFKETLPFLNTLKIPRQVVCLNMNQLELHGFADASNKAYGACVYVRSVNEQGEVHINLLISKTRVAPLKTVTIPRLELCAATLLAQLVSRVQSTLTVQISDIHLWSDSTVTLHWIHTPPNTLQVFVSHRVAKIQTLTRIEDWRHIKSGDNPADLLTKGVPPGKMENISSWWHGPNWLLQAPDKWPITSNLNFNIEPPETKRASKALLGVDPQARLDIDRFSSFKRLQRTLAYCMRFIKNCQVKKTSRTYGFLCTKELQEVTKSIIKFDQEQYFKEELRNLKNGASVNRKSALHKLNPFLDTENIIRVGGRIQCSEYKYEKKYPMVIGKTHLATLLLRYEHERLKHVGTSTTLASIREKYWPIAGKTQLKKIIFSCIKCFRTRPRLQTPIMGSLPVERVTPALPFMNTGVDYAGPVLIKNKTGRGCKLIKSYICLFVCMSTKALHLELATDLTKDSFLAAFWRFTSRRGKPHTMHSDNGTNFVAAEKELSKFVRETQTTIATVLEDDGIAWKFIPARAPHFGGLWEAGVKQVKLLIKRIVGNHHFTYEQFNTILIQTEGILNSRPISPLSDDPNDLNALTPGHFLTGRRLVSPAEGDYSQVVDNRLTNFQLTQKLQQQYWNRWKKEYIGELQVRTKWTKTSSSLKEGMLVLIKDEHTPPLKWPMGRVIQVFSGPDGVARVATIRTSNGIIKRAFSKICPLPREEV